MVKILIHGCSGHMGQVVSRLAGEDEQLRTVAGVDPFPGQEQAYPVYQSLQEYWEKAEEKADVIVFSCYIWNIDYVRELAEELKKVSPGVQIWAGGPEVSYDAERFLRENPAVDLVMQGEGERTFAALVMKMEEMTVGVTGKNTAHEMVVGVAGKNTAHEMPDGVAGGDAAHDMPAGVAWREPAGGTAGGGEMASDNAPGGRETALPDKNVLIYNTGFAPVMDMDETIFFNISFRVDIVFEDGLKDFSCHLPVNGAGLDHLDHFYEMFRSEGKV